MIGILSEWYLQIALLPVLISCIGLLIVYGLFFLFPPATRFSTSAVPGFILNALLLNLGLLITWQQDIRNDNNWYGNIYQNGDQLVVKIDEPIIEKLKSARANGAVEAIIRNNKPIPCKGKILLYFSKPGAGGSARPSSSPLQYGDKILFAIALQPIKNTGNPGAFNYERYAAFQQVFHNVFLKEKDWVKLQGKDINRFNQFIFTARDDVLYALRKNISSGSDELGLAEALLIGYTYDLDKDLVKAYSNTGVVHIIAISGMHLALIYLLLVSIFEKIPGLNKSKLLQVSLVLICLWLFSLLTGAAASVIRSAVMFTFITIGTHLKKKASIYNSLAASAFVILCYNPYFLWDVGFQLSYLAVISIIVFQKSVHHCWQVKNKWGQKIWELAAVSLSAQVLTFPVCIYYFHQFPNYFLLTNIIAVPLSSVILYAEIGLLTVSWIPFVGPLSGKVVAWLVWLMNKVILCVNELPFAVWQGIPATVLSTWLLYAVVVGFSAWGFNKERSLLRTGLVCLFAFVLVCSYNSWTTKNQRKLVVYNITKHQAIDFINGNDFTFVGDTALLNDLTLQNYNLVPARVALQLTNDKIKLKDLFQLGSFYQFNNTKILLIDSRRIFEIPDQKIKVDIIVISHNPGVRIAQLAGAFDCGQYVFDASNSLWKIDQWQKDCEELHLRSYSVPAAGAFVLDVN